MSSMKADQGCILARMIHLSGKKLYGDFVPDFVNDRHLPCTVKLQRGMEYKVRVST
jgi:hypothetical protein